MPNEDETDIDDEYAPEFEEAEYLIEILLEAYGDRQRLRGKKGEMLHELLTFRERAKEWDALRPEEKRGIVNRLWILNSGNDPSIEDCFGEPSWGTPRHEILGPGRFPWRGRGRPPGNRIGEFPSDEEMIREALALVEAEHLSLGAALRRVVVTRGSKEFNVESVIKRLRRTISSGGS